MLVIALVLNAMVQQIHYYGVVRGGPLLWIAELRFKRGARRSGGPTSVTVGAAFAAPIDAAKGMAAHVRQLKTVDAATAPWMAFLPNWAQSPPDPVTGLYQKLVSDVKGVSHEPSRGITTRWRVGGLGYPTEPEAVDALRRSMAGASSSSDSSSSDSSSSDSSSGSGSSVSAARPVALNVSRQSGVEVNMRLLILFH